MRLEGIPPNDGYGLSVLVNRIEKNYYAPTTSVSMISRVRKFYAFLTRHRLWTVDTNGQQQVPALTYETLVFYTGFLCQTLSPRGFMQTTYGSICAYLSAIRIWARSNGRPDPAIDQDTGGPHLRYIRYLKATKRELAGKAMTRKPLSVEHLRAMVLALRLGTVVHGPVVTDMVAAMLLAFFALLRVSECTVPTRTDLAFDPEVHATRGDIQFEPNIESPTSIRFRVKVSKTDQFRVGHDLVVFCSKDPSFCCVKALQRLYLEDPQPLDAPLFDFTCRRANRPVRNRSMDRPSYIKCFHAAVASVGLDSSSTKTHSLRSGGATAMLRAGVPTYVVSQLGRWKSHCWTHYVWASFHLVRTAHQLLGSDLPDSRPVDLDAVRRYD